MSFLAWKELSIDIKTLTDEELFFLFQIEKGWQKKLGKFLEKNPDKFPEYWERIKEEVQVILKMRFPGYFLITQDFLVWGDGVGIRRGPGRGSAGGCLVAFLMDITKIDPIKYNLLFSRFLNADRISMPDIDNDIETDRRDEVKEYIKKKYGEDKVASISTFGTMKVRGGIKDIIRSLNLGGSKSEAFKLADLINNSMPDEAEITFDEACQRSPEFKALVWYPSDEEIANGWKLKLAAGELPSKFPLVGLHIRKLEGIIRQTGTHAAGVVISPEKLSRILPIAIDKNNVTVTASSGKMVEDAGFLKIDLLGLNTLSIIQRCVENIKKTRNFELKGMPLSGISLVPNESEEDFEKRLEGESEGVIQASRAYRLLRSGKTEGIFQCESSVAKSLLQDLQVNSIEDISIVLALNRPGPLKAGLTKEFGGRKFGTIPWELPHPSTEKILGPTFSILCIAKGQPVYNPKTGRNISIEQIPSHALVQSYNQQNNTSVLNFSAQTRYNGIKSVKKYTLITGYEIICTEDHVVETCLGEMSIGKAFDRQLSIALPKTLRVEQAHPTTFIQKEKLRILGLLISEGSLANSTAIHFTSSEEVLKQDFLTRMKNAYPRCKIERFPGRTEGAEGFTVSKDDTQYTNESIRLNYIPNDLLVDLRKWGLKYNHAAASTTEGGCNSHTKFIPDFVFTLDRESKLIFVGALWDGDGCCAREQSSFFYTTSSLRLAQDLVLLLRQLGFLPTFFARNDGAYRVGLPPEQYSIVSKYCIVERKKDIIYEGDGEKMTTLNRQLVMERIQSTGLRASEVARRSQISLSTISNYSQSTKANPNVMWCTAVRKIAKGIDDPVLKQLMSDIYWVPIKKAEEIGDSEVYDLQMEDSSNPWFIGGFGGIVLHNCYQEQCMQLAVACAGFTMAESDTLRKCIRKGSLIQMADGSRKAIETVQVGEEVLSLTEKGLITFKKVISKFENGSAKLVRLITNKGFLDLTSSHKLLTGISWQPISQLRVGDLIAFPNKFPKKEDQQFKYASNRRKFQRQHLRLLGYLIGDGNTTTGTPHFFNKEQEVLADYEQQLYSLVCGRGFDKEDVKNSIRRDLHPKTGSITLTPSGTLGQALIKLCKDCDVYDKYSYEKTIPEEIFSYPLSYIKNIIGTLWTTDGCIEESNDRLSYASTSKVLVLQIIALLLKYGIRSYFNVKPKTKENYHDSYELFITNTRDIKIFAMCFQEQIVGPKVERLSRLVEYREKMKANYNGSDMIPLSFREKICKQIATQILSISQLERQLGWAHNSLNIFAAHRQSKGYSRSSLKEVAEALGDPILFNIACNDIEWVEILAIEELEQEDEVYDLEIEDTHNYIANNVIVHNCIGKKNLELMVKFEKQFIEGCYKRHSGFDTIIEYELLEENPDGSVKRIMNKGTLAQRMWKEILFFASYGFNKSHSVSYAHNTYYTAFLKANYPAEFWAAQLSYESDQVKINRMIMEAKNNGIKILPVSINTSSLGYESESPTTIRRSLGTLKAVGGAAIEELCAHRPYQDLVDFLQKCNMRKINKKTLRALICAGAFDEFNISRKTLDEKIQDCKMKLDKWCKRRLDAYIKFAGAHKTCVSKPSEQDLIRLSDPTSGNEEAFIKKDEPKYSRIRHISRLTLKKWLEIKDGIRAEEDDETLEEAQQAQLKALVNKWEAKANQIFQEGEWSYNFIEREEDKNEWPLEILIANEKEVYGTAVSAHVFDKYLNIEKRVDEKFPTNRYTLDQTVDSLGSGMEVVLMVEVLGCSRQFPYKKDPTKFVRLFQIEDRFGTQELTVFEKSYDDFIEDEKGTPVRVLSAGNIIVCKAKASHYGTRKSLVYEKCLKLVASRRR